MMQNLKPDTCVLYTETWLVEMFEVLDELHSAASDGQLQQMTGLNRRELMGWLRDVVYTAEETLQELDRTASEMPMLKLLEPPPAKRRQVNGF